MDPYAVNTIPGTSVATHISLLHVSMVAHVQDPFFEFHNNTIRACRLLWPLPTIAPWVEYRIHYLDFTMKGALGWDGPRFQI